VLPRDDDGLTTTTQRTQKGRDEEKYVCITHTKEKKKHDMKLDYDCHGCSHSLLHFFFVKNKVAWDERRRESTFENIRCFERRQ
jgi:hypothetical protein